MRIKSKRPLNRQPKKYYITNDRIVTKELRVIDDKGEFVGVMSREEAIQKAYESNADLILIAPGAQPPVAKIIDLHKHMYNEEKKEQEAKKGSKSGDVKEVQITIFMGAADLARMVEKAREFLKEEGQVKVNMRLRGAQLRKVPMALDNVRTFIKELGEVNIVQEPKFEAKVIRAIVARKK